MNLEEEKQLDELQLVVFTIGDEEFGVDIGDVLEIIKMTNITEVPNVPDYVNGIINLRGQIVTVVDLKKKLECGKVEETGDTRIMIVRVHENTLGMIVDSVTEVMRINKENISPAPKNLQSQIHQDYIDGVGKLGDRLILLVNLEGVLLKEDVNEIAAQKQTPDGEETEKTPKDKNKKG